MAVALRGHSFGFSGFSGAGVPASCVVPKPAGTQVGDLVVVHMTTFRNYQPGSSAGYTPSESGWTQIIHESGGDGYGTQGGANWFTGEVIATFARFVTAGDPANYTFTAFGPGTTQNSILYQISSWSGSASLPTVSARAAGGASQATEISAPQITASVGDVVMTVAFGQGNSPATTYDTFAQGSGLETTLDHPNYNNDFFVTYYSPSSAGPSYSGQKFWSPSGGNGVAIWTLLLASNAPPNASTNLSPTGNATIDRTAIQRFSWTFNDPNPGDTQSKFDIQYRLVGAGTWTQILNQVSVNSYYDFAANFFAAGNYEWQVRTYDSQGAQGAWSASSFFTAATPPSQPTLTAPANNAIISSTPAAVTWSVPQQDGYQIRRVRDNAGVPDTTTVYYDTGDTPSTSLRATTIPFETNGRYEHVQLRIRVGTLWSAWASNRVQVSYNPPPAPTGFTVTPNSAGGYTDLAWTNPAAGGGQVAISYVDVYRLNTVTGVEKRIATQQATTFRDWTAASGVLYQYRVVAFGANGVSTSAAPIGGTLKLRGTWIQDPLSPSTTAHRFAWDGNGRTVDREFDVAEQSYVGRTNPVVEFGTNERTTISISLQLDNDTNDVTAMTSLVSIRRPLLYRDGRGRKEFVSIAGLPYEDHVYGEDMSFEAVVVDGTDVV
jgi:hypothetical protein